MRVTSLYRYPVKGLSPEPLEGAELTKGAYFPGDRLYAVENGPAGFDPEAPQHQSKTKFLMLMRNEELARLTTRYEDDLHTLAIELDGRQVAEGDLTTEEGRQAIETFLEGFVPRAMRGPAKVLEAPPGFRFTDSRSGHVSIINLGSVRALEAMVGAPVDPLRFRGNIMVEGLDPWAELDLVGRRLIGPEGLELKVTKRIVRCAATNVNPGTAERDLNIPKTLMHELGHMDCGIYAEVVRGGTIRPGDLILREPDLFASA